jgi:hypothetical protein
MIQCDGSRCILSIDHCPGHTRRGLCAKAAAGDARYIDYIRNEAKRLPPLATQARNLSGAVAAHVASGLQHAPPEQQRTRQAICRTCEHWRASDQRCAKCGCFTQAKTAWASSVCPIGKW